MAYRNLTAGQVDVSVEVAVLRGKVGYGAAYLAAWDIGVVRMSFGEDKPGLAGVGAEEFGDEGGVIGAVRGFLYFVFGDLDSFASAVPAVGWIVGAPERVVDALGNTIESAMLIAHVLISGGLVAEVREKVLLILELLPAGGLGGGGYAGVVFGLEPCAVELGIDGGDLVAEIGKATEVAFFVAEGGGDGAKFLIVLGSGEAENVLREAGEHEVIGGVPVDGNEVIAITTVDTFEKGAGGGIEQVGVVMDATALLVDADAETGYFVGKVREFVSLCDRTGRNGIKMGYR